MGAVKVSVNDLLIKAAAGALQRVPEANAIWAGDAIRRFRSVDIAVAVAVPNGLVTPVVRGVEGRPSARSRRPSATSPTAPGPAG